VAAGPPAFELPPAVLPALCASANVLVNASAATKTSVFIFIVVSSSQGWKPKDEIELSQFGSYFFRTPVSVLLRLFTALFAAGVFTAADEDDPPPGSA
jgi:hypothetical protein